MKLKIVLTILLITLMCVINRGVFYPVDVVVQNTLAVNTVNGGDSAYVAQNAYHATSHIMALLGTLGVLAIIGFMWFPSKKS